MRAQENPDLDDTERAELRGKIRAFMAEHPARAPFAIRVLDWTDAHATRAGHLFSSTRFRFTFSAALLILVVGGGTSYAAQTALPGDALYPVKIGINEKIAAAFATSPEDHVRLDAQLTERRLQEAETLAATGKLSAADGAQIETSLNLATADFDTQVAVLATSSESGAAVATDAQSALEATLAAHSQVLAEISQAVPKASVSVSQLQASLRENITAMRSVRAKVEDQFAASTSVSVETAAQTSSQDAHQASDAVQALVQQVATNLGASSSAAVAARASRVEEVVAAGEAHMNHGSYKKALGAFQSAISAAQQTKTEVDATEQLKEAVPSLTLPTAATTIDTGDSESGIDATSTSKNTSN